MTSTYNPVHASIDSIIHWLRGQRCSRPDTPLPQLLDISSLPLERLTDVACIDLIERKRLGQTICVEDILQDIPVLASSESALLDLVDAEICVQIELGQPVNLRDYEARFPEHATSIAAIAQLNAGDVIVDTSVGSNKTIEIRHDHEEEGLALQHELANDHRVNPLGVGGVSSHSTNGSALFENAVHPPPWFTREQVHSQTEQSCLIRGRDSNENRAVALKMIRLSDRSRQTAESALADIEAVSSVRHPAWVQPDVAAIESQTLAVIRPWIFGTRWDTARRHASVEAKLHDLARVGYALQAAHDTKTQHGMAGHGGLHLNNLIVDADGQVRIVDAAATIQPAAGEMLVGQPMSSQPLSRPHDERSSQSHRRRMSDVRSLCVLIRLVTGGDLAKDRDFRRRAESLDRFCHTLFTGPLPTDACALIADAAIKLADGKWIESQSAGMAATAKAIWNQFRQR